MHAAVDRKMRNLQRNPLRRSSQLATRVQPLGKRTRSPGTLLGNQTMLRLLANSGVGSPAKLPPAIQRGPGVVSEEEGNGREDGRAVVSEQVRRPGRPLDSGTQRRAESWFGEDFSGVRIHTGVGADRAARALGARAFTFGNSIVFGSGRYSPSTSAGQRLLAHELVHAVQQSGGRAPQHIRRQPEDCPSFREVEPEHPGTCPGVTRDDRERTEYNAAGARLREVQPYQCYIIENLPIGGTAFAAADLLRDIDATLFLTPDIVVHITGFTDCLGPQAVNRRLRLERAEAVRQHLASAVIGGSTDFVVRTESLDSYLAPNDTAGHRAKNRAVVIYLESPEPVPVPEPEPEPEPAPEPAPESSPCPPPSTGGRLSDYDCACAIARSLGTEWQRELPPCPCNAPEDAEAWDESNTGISCFHPGATNCFRQEAGGHSQQCCYDAEGRLITSGAAAGTPDRYVGGLGRHQEIDVWPWIQLGWQTYNTYWVPNKGVGCDARTVGGASSGCWIYTRAADRPDTCSAQ